MTMPFEEKYADFSDDIRSYMSAHGGSPNSLMRVLQRLRITLPSSPDAAHDLIAGYIRRDGEDAFRERMGLLRAPTSDSRLTPPPEQPVRLRWKNKRKSQPTSFGEKAPAAPSDPWVGAERSVQMRATDRKTIKAPPMPKQPDDSVDLPAVLQGIPRSVITPEALAAAENGENPFGPPPLIERRSGLDRRSGHDRRDSVELVFTNSRYGKDRRSGEERRADPPPLRDADTSAEAATGSPRLRALGWRPPTPEPEEE